MKIIAAAEVHLEELALLFDAYRVFYEKETDVMGVAAFLKERMANHDSEIFMLMNEQEVMAGFVQLYPLFSSVRMKRWWLLNDLFVKPEFRGRGYSKLLIERCKKLAMDTQAAGLSLETAISNQIGNRLYPEAGFELDTQHNYYYWENKTV